MKHLTLQEAGTLQFSESTQVSESLNVLAWCGVDSFKDALRTIFVLTAAASVVQTRLALPYGLGEGGRGSGEWAEGVVGR